MGKTSSPDTTGDATGWNLGELPVSDDGLLGSISAWIIKTARLHRGTLLTNRVTISGSEDV
jgi:hypothetical protein